MAYKNENEDVVKSYYKPIKNRLSEKELLSLDKELSVYFIEKEISFPEKMIVKILNEKKWLFDRGATNESGAVIIQNYEPAKYSIKGVMTKGCDCKPILFEQLNEDLEQWHFWKGKKEWIENKKIEGLEEIAKGMKM